MTLRERLEKIPGVVVTREETRTITFFEVQIPWTTDPTTEYAIYDAELAAFNEDPNYHFDVRVLRER